MPPSKIVALPPRSGALLVGVVPSTSLYMLPPLSEKKTIIVRSAIFRRSSVSSSVPTASSMLSTIAA